MPGITLRIESLRAAGLRGNAGHALPPLAIQLGRLHQRIPGFAPALLGFLGHAIAVLALQHLLILLQQVLGHVEDRAPPAAVTVAAPPLVLRLLPRAVLDVVALDALLVLLLLEHAGPASPLEEAVPPSLQILEHAVPAGLRVPQDRVLALLPDGAEEPRQRRLLFHHRRDGAGRVVLGGRVTVLRLADVHLGCFHANWNGHELPEFHSRVLRIAENVEETPSWYLTYIGVAEGSGSRSRLSIFTGNTPGGLLRKNSG